MKKIITAALLLFSLAAVYAQSPSEADIVTATTFYNSIDNVRTEVPNTVNIKALRNFYNRYGDANNESWYATSGGFRAKFHEYGIAFMADYNKKGAWIRTIKTYGENKLPKETRERVKREYYDQRIFLVQEINQYDETIYLISIEDSASWKTLKLTNETMETIATYEK